MNQREYWVLVLAVCLLGCDHFAGARTVEGNDYTRMPNHLREAGDGFLPGKPSLIFAADLNGDGRDDLVTYHADYSFIHVGMNHYTQHLSDVYFAFGSEPLFVPELACFALDDLEGDGVQEIAVVDREGGTISWYAMHHSFYNKYHKLGPRWVPRRIKTEAVPCLGSFDMGLALVDVNRDGKRDLLCGQRQGSTWELSVHLRADHGFGQAIKSKMGSGGGLGGDWILLLAMWRLGDLDGDGHPDLIATHGYGPGLQVHFGDGAGRFEGAKLLAPGFDGFSPPPAVGDIDGDGLVDVVWREPKTEGLSLFWGNRDRAPQRSPAEANLAHAVWDTFHPYPIYPHDATAADRWAIGDLDGDGTGELVRAGFDRDYGEEGPVFIRVHRGSTKKPVVVSNSQICTASECGFGADLLTGSFLGTKRQQVLVVAQGLVVGVHGYRAFDWVERPGEETPRCGDGVIQAGEQCDGLTLDHGGSSFPHCGNVGGGPGHLACDSQCHYDTSGCHPPLELGVSATPTSPAIGCGDGLCLVAWVDGGDLYSVRVDSNTKSLLDAVPRRLAAAIPASTHIAVAAETQGFWVVWTDKDQALRASRIGRDGKAEPALTLASSGQRPSVTCHRAGCLLVWSGPAGIEARRIAAGKLSGKPITVGTSPGRPLGPAAVASDGSGYLVVWEREQGGVGQIRGARLDGAGQVLDSPAIPLAAGSGDRRAPAVTFNGESYLVLWTDDTNHVGTYGVRVSPAGQVLDLSPFPVAAGVEPASAAGNGLSLVTSVQWTDDVIATQVSQHSRIVPFPPEGTSSTTLGYLTGHICEAPLAPRPSVSFDGNRFVAAWGTRKCGKPLSYNIRCTFVDAAAK